MSDPFNTMDKLEKLKEIRDAIGELQKSGYGLLIALFTFIGVFMSQGNLKGETMAGAALAPDRMKESDGTEQVDDDGKNAAEASAVEGTEDEQPPEGAEEGAMTVAEAKKKAFQDPAEMPARPPKNIDADALWLARCIYSETKQPREQELVAWVIRNRVETGYRGNNSYREVVLDPYQFSAFNPGSPKRSYFMNLNGSSDAEGWQRALNIAKHVADAPSSERPFSQDTRHFYSERSMAGGRQPNWASGERPVKPDRPYEIVAERFRFYSDVS